MKTRWGAFAMLAVCALNAACSTSDDERSRPLPSGVTRIDVVDPDTHWARRGFVEMVPAVAPPVARGGRGRIQVFLKIPEGGRITVVERDGRALLQYPPGTIADRVESLSSKDKTRWAVSDVRGTKIRDDGTEEYHVYRPLRSGFDGSPLFGYAWPKDDPEAGEATFALFREAFEHRSGFLFPHRGERLKRRIRTFHAQHACAACHVAGKPAAVDRTAKLPFRPTDARGFYAPLSVLVSSGMLETYRPRDLNHEDSAVTLRCAEADVTPERHDDGKGGVRFTCGDETAHVWADVDVPAGLRQGNPRIRKLCAARRYLFDHMAPGARRAFVSAFAACGISEPDSQHNHPTDLSSKAE